jgi:peptidoglycan-N-acetylglucosamine deacetylase
MSFSRACLVALLVLAFGLSNATARAATLEDALSRFTADDFDETSKAIRFPDLKQPPALIAYLGTRNVATFSTDIDTFDFKLHKPEDVINSAMTKLAKNGKGILLIARFPPQHGRSAARAASSA